MKIKLLPLIIVATIGLASLAGGFYQSSRPLPVIAGDVGEPGNFTNDFQEALTTAQEGYAGQLDLELLGKAAIQGMLHQLDPHSSYFTKAEFDELQTEQRSRIYGIGVTIVKRYDRVYIISVTPGAPASRSGLRYGDAIIAIDGQNVEEWSNNQVMHRVRGEKGEPVELTVERAGSPTPITARIRRDEVRLPSVRNYFMVDQANIGYVALTGGFSSKTSEELTDALTKLKQEGMRQLVLDLRDNPGGLLDQAVEVASKFLPPGLKVLDQRSREGRFPERTYEVPDNNDPETMPMVILVNRGTASASEVVAGALQDHDRALIVGETSFGKGLVQSVIRLWGGAGLTLTTGRYYTPTGRSLQRDYSAVSFYDYYANRTEQDKEGPVASRGDGLRTDLGRMVYGGGGIAPDIPVKMPGSEIRTRLFFGVFDFVRQLVAGQVSSLRDYKIAETQHKKKLSSDDISRYPVTEKLLAAFRQHIAAKPHFNVTDEQFTTHLDYVRTQMRRELMTAAHGLEAGEQTYLADDIQLRKAIESLERARELADNARRARGDRQ